MDREDLTTQQKSWLVRAWTWLFGCVPNAIPEYDEKHGFHLHKGWQTHWHHITPIGESTRLDGNGNYNHPGNIVPVDAKNHVGRGATENDFVIHPDTQEATQQYGKWKKQGGVNPYEQMGKDRRRLTTQGRGYHDTRLDGHFEDLAERVADGYSATHPEDQWPPGKKRKK